MIGVVHASEGREWLRVLLLFIFKVSHCPTAGRGVSLTEGTSTLLPDVRCRGRVGGSLAGFVALFRGTVLSLYLLG